MLRCSRERPWTPGLREEISQPKSQDFTECHLIDERQRSDCYGLRLTTERFRSSKILTPSCRIPRLGLPLRAAQHPPNLGPALGRAVLWAGMDLLPMRAVFFVIFKDVLKIQLLTEGGEKRDFFFFKTLLVPSL